MGRTVLRIAGLAVLVAALHVPAAHAQTRFSFGIGVGRPAPPVYVAPPVVAPYGFGAGYDGYYWEPAYRVWIGSGYRMVPGRWVRRDFRAQRFESERWRRERGRSDYRRR